jgi:predicted TIM-barrel fold metal-dependent hydrolase
MPDLIPILDTHQHLVYPDQYPYSWTGSVPALAGRAFRYDNYLAAIAGAGITRSIFMETSPDDPHWRREAHFVQLLSRQPKSLIGGVIANCRPELPGFAEYVESVRDARLVGFRRILHVEPDELSQSPLFVANVRSLGKQNLTFDLCVRARQIPLAIDLVRQCPQTQFILDHCGNPDIAADIPGRGGKGEPSADWRRLIGQIAALPNVACKISGIAANCKPGSVTTDLLRPYVEQIIHCFGWDRVVWGSDWPVCLVNCSLAAWAEHTQKIVAAASVEDQRKLFHENAARIYRVAAK